MKIIDCIDNFICVSTFDGIVQSLNRSARALLPKSPDLNFKQLVELVIPDHQGKFLKGLEIAKIGEPYRATVKFKVQKNELWFDFDFMPFEEGTFLVNGTNVNSRVVSEERLKEKTEEVKAFAFMVTHDLKNPLSSLKGFVSLLAEELSHGDQTISRIMRLIDKMENLTGSILKYAKITSRTGVEVKEVDLVSLLEQILDDFGHLLQKIEIRKQFGETFPIMADEGIVVEAIRNLISNCIKYRGKAGSWIEITMKDVGYPVLIVADNGLGIPEDKLSQLFKPFFRAHSLDANKVPIEGTGLGLAGVKKLLSLMNASIEIDSNEGVGTTVTISFS